MFEEAAAFNQDLSTWNVGKVTNMDNMFTNAIAFNQNIDKWNISSVTRMKGMLNGTAISIPNYDATLLGWATLNAGETKIPTGVNLGAGGLFYTTTGQVPRTSLTSTRTWTITGDALVGGPILPTITSFTPISGSVGTALTISGTNFSTTPTNNMVNFNGTAAIVTASTTTTITTTVPLGATTGKITVAVSGNTATSQSNFTVTTVPDAITITTQPPNIIACIGETTFLFIVASGTTNITYQWQKFDGTVFNDINNGGGYSGATTSALTINTANNFGSGDYRCEVSGDNVTPIFSEIASLTLIVNTTLAEITLEGSTLTASSGNSYKWFYFNEPIAGATNQSIDINIFEYGVYAVQVTSDGCTARSEDFVYLITANEILSEGWKIYPNPFTFQLNIESPSSGTMEIEVVDILGKYVKSFSDYNSNFILLDDLKSGTYFLNIYSGKQSKHFRITKAQ